MVEDVHWAAIPTYMQNQLLDKDAWLQQNPSNYSVIPKCFFFFSKKLPLASIFYIKSTLPFSRAYPNLTFAHAP
jgi:hypothetical protein